MIPDGKIVAVNFRPGAGGKFIQNCLGLSKHCLLKKLEWANWQIDCPVINANYYRQKLTWALTTVPSISIVDLCASGIGIEYPLWLTYELSDRDFFSRWFNDDEMHNFSTQMISPIFAKAAQNNKWVTYSVHSYDGTKNLSLIWPTVKHVYLTPADKFADTWLPYKNPELASRDDDWSNCSTPPDEAFYFDIDNTIHNEQKFLDQMSKLYSWLGWDDFAQTFVPEYYRAYISIHK